MATHRSNISDVARQAGVSISTVSRVLNGTAPVDEETAERVRSAAAGFAESTAPASYVSRMLMTGSEIVRTTPSMSFSSSSRTRWYSALLEVCTKAMRS